MIVYVPFLLLVVGAVLAYGSAGRRRQLGTAVMVSAAGWALALLTEPGTAAWVIGPLLATFLLRRPPERARSTFEVLTRRAGFLAIFTVLGLVLAARLPYGENPLLLNVVPWLLAAVGTAWVLNPIDAVERLQGQVLMVGASAALLLAAVPAGTTTAIAAGAMSIVPLFGDRLRVPAMMRPMLSTLMVLGAVLAAGWAALGPPLERPAISDLALNVGGPVLLGIAIVLLAGALLAPAGIEWAALIGVLALAATAPSLRWSALAALVAVATTMERAGERPAWFALVSLAAVPFLQALAPPLWSARFQAVALGAGVVVMLFAAKQAPIRVLLVPPTAFLVLIAVQNLNAGNLTRFQWVVACGSLLFIALTAIARLRPAVGPPVVVGDRLLQGLPLLAIGARDALGLGALAVVVLVIALSIVRLDDAPAPPSRALGSLFRLARSNWPPSATFAGATLTVIGTLQASLALGLLAALTWAALQLAPVLDRRVMAAGPERPRSSLTWLAPALGLAVGVAPAVVLRMLKL